MSTPGTGRDKSLRAGMEKGSVSHLHSSVGLLGCAVQSSGVPSLCLKEILDQMGGKDLSRCSLSQNNVC